MNEKIREFLHQHGAGGDIQSVVDDESLLEAGIIDSAAMIDLITFLEKEFDVVIDEDDMTPENFDSIQAIVSYLSAKPA